MKKFYYLSSVFLTLLLIGANVSTIAQATLVQPTSTGIVWVIGNTYNITWTGTNANGVDIYYRITNLGPEFQLADDESGNTFSWNTATNFGGAGSLGESTDYQIVLRDGTTSDVLAFSLNYFELTNDLPAGTGTIHVNQPNVSGIQWAPGSTYGIYWDDDLVEPVKIELWEDDGSGNTLQAYSGGVDPGLPTSVEGTGYNWAIPAGITEGTQYAIKVLSTITDDEDESDNYFAITSSPSGGTEVEMIQPDVDGLQWESGTTHLISWMDDLIENVDSVLYVQWPVNTGPYIPYVNPTHGTVDSDLPTDNVGTTVDWEIPELLPNGSYKVYAVSSVTSSIDDISEFPFQITDSPSGGTTITLIQPDVAGIQWLFETTHLISWMDDLIDPVNIELWHSVEGLIDPADSGIPDADYTGTTWEWAIPAESAELPATGTYQIKIIGSITTSESDITEFPFTLTDTPSGGTEITVIQPSVTGIEWEEGTEHLISWMDDLIEPVNIKLVDYTDPNNPSDVDPGDSGIPTDDFTGTTWTWDIPTGLTLYNDIYKIEVTSSVSSITGISTENFTIIDYSPGGEIIVIQPNGGEEWIKGNSYLISWTDNISENVKIEATNNSTAGTPDWEELAASVEGSTWTWNTATNWPDPSGTPWPATGTEFKIKISSTNTNSTTTPDESDNPFDFVNTIGGNVWVIQPNGGEVWNDDTDYLISWNDELVENVYIKLYRDDVLVLADHANLPAYDGDGVEGSTYTWSIPETDDGTTYFAAGEDLFKIVVESIYSSSYGDDSDDYFTIADTPTGGDYIEVIQPNGGELWALNTTHLISWNDDVVENVDIDLYDNQATPVFIAEIANDVPGTTHDWLIDDALYGVGTYLVRIYSTVDPANASDYSDAYFTVTASKGSVNNFNLNNISGNLVIYPNPTSTQFTVAAAGIINRVEVRNLLGQVLYTNNVEATQTSIDITGYEAGMYIVNIIVEGEVVTHKLFIQ